MKSANKLVSFQLLDFFPDRALGRGPILSAWFTIPHSPNQDYPSKFFADRTITLNTKTVKWSQIYCLCSVQLFIRWMFQGRIYIFFLEEQHHQQQQQQQQNFIYPKYVRKENIYI